uniref:IS66 family transposase n=1 Tax=Pararhizobium sp. IMCC3301 TaxID=3067904 RepID=UPI0027421A60|nr:transposase [Pararhizobium sp. IMCC3301]
MPRVSLRQKNAQLIFDDLETWLHAQLPKIADKSLSAKAIRHALSWMPKTRACLDNGFLKLDNTSAECAMKPARLV